MGLHSQKIAASFAVMVNVKALRNVMMGMLLQVTDALQHVPLRLGSPALGEDPL